MWENLSIILDNLNSILALVVLLLLIAAFIYMKKIHFSTRMIMQLGLMIALTVILHMIRLYHLPHGGSITLGGMLPLLLVAFCYGPAVGFLTGFCYGLLNLIQDPFILSPLQVLFYKFCSIIRYLLWHSDSQAFLSKIFISELQSVSPAALSAILSPALYSSAVMYRMEHPFIGIH